MTRCLQAQLCTHHQTKPEGKIIYCGNLLGVNSNDEGARAKSRLVVRDK